MKLDQSGQVIDPAKAAAAEAWWLAWRQRRRRMFARDPDDMTPAWVDPNAPSTPSSDLDSRYDGASFEDETGR